ncbi:MAG: hypothetical protein LBH66_08980 [Oscillospiraceae bacterium]|nr:hypothetical protein [Oscillospiraceae bacterium]
MANELRLMNLNVTNFKGLSRYAFNPGGHDASIRGTNASGKTTVCDAFAWLLFGKDSLDRADFEIRPIRPADRQAADAGTRAGDTVVEGVIHWNGAAHTLTRSYREKWTRARGSTSEQFAGHETACAIDGVPKSVSEYKAFVERLIPEQVFRSITSTRYFCGLKWQDRRRMLFDMAGDIPESELFAGELEPLRAAIGKNSVEDYIKIIKAEQTRINRDLDGLRTRCDEAARAIDKNADASPLAQVTEDELEHMRREAADLRGDDKSAAIRKELEQARRDLEHLNIIETARVNGERSKDSLIKRGRITALRNERENLRLDQSRREREIEVLKQRGDDLASGLERLRSRWRELEALKAAYQPEEACPHCGQSIPPDKIAVARSAFIAETSKQQEALVAESKYYTDEQLKASDRLRRLTDTSAAGFVDFGARISQLDKQIEAVESSEPDFPPDSGYIDASKAATEKIAHLEQSLAQAETDGIEEAARERVNQLNASIERIKNILYAVKMNAVQRARVSELERKHSEAGAQYERNNLALQLCEEYTRRKMRLTSERVNSLFRLVEWRLYTTQVNGGIADDCTPMIGGVPYSDLNSASRVNAGIDCVNALCRWHDVAAPVWVDNAEGIVDVLPTRGQMIRLVVDAKESELAAETEDEQHAA